MTRLGKLRSVTIVALLLVGTLSAVSIASLFLGALSPVFPSISPVNAAGGTPVLGFDCGLGERNAADIDGDGVPDPDGTLNTLCVAAYDADASLDGIIEPLVSDNPAAFLPGTGGGMIVEIRAIGLPLNTNGFDITLSYDKRYANGVIITQTGLPFDGSFTLEKSIDRNTGIVRVAQVLLAGSVSGDVTLFRLRLDIIGSGVSQLQITNSVITNPGAVPHKVQNTSLDSAAFFAPSFFDVFFDVSPVPAVPGSPLTLTATASCVGCAGPLAFSWDTNSDGIPDASGNPATITPPPPVVHRIVLTVDGGAGSMAIATELLPLSLVATGPSTLAVNTPGTWTGRWLGGIPSYTGAWRFCPGTLTTANAICHRPAPTIAAAAGADQIDAQTLNSLVAPLGAYHFAGVYTNTLRITDSMGTLSPQAGPSTTLTYTFLVNVTGTPLAYTVTISNPAKVSTGTNVTFTATIRYASTYPTLIGTVNPRSSSFDVTFDFGDGTSSIRSITGCSTAEPPTAPCTVSASHIYNVGSTTTFNVRARAQETLAAAVSKIQELGTSSITVNAGGMTADFTFTPANPTAGKPVTFTGTVTGGTAPHTFSWNFGDGSPVQTGNPVSHTYAVKGNYMVTLTVTDSAATTATATHAVVVGPQPLVVSVDCPNSGLTAGKPFNCNVTATGGTAPYTGTGSRSASFPTKGSFTVTFSVTDANAVTASGSDPVSIAAQPLVVTVDCPNSGLTAGKPFSCTVSATGGTAPYTGTGTISVTRPTKGTFTQSFTVTDANAVSATGSDSVTIAAQPLVVTVDCPNTGLTAGKPFNCNVSATGGTAPYTGTGVRSATQPTKGTFTQSFSVTDANGATASGSDSVTIAAQPLVVTVDCPNTGLTAGKPFNCNVTATGGTAPYTGTGSRSATQPTKGTFTQSFTVTDANAVSATGSDSVTIAAQPLVVTVACPNSGLTAGKPFNCTVTATGGTAPYTGTGTRSATQPTKGTFSQSFTVTDANGASASGSDPVTIAAQPLVVTVDCPNTGLTAGKPFNCNVTATGGTAPYTGTGVRSATQPTKGTFTQSFTVTDANAVSATGSDPVTIAAQPLVVTVDCPNTGLTAGKPFNCNVTATGGTAPYTGTGSRSATQPTKGTFTQSFSVTDANAVSATGSYSVTIAAQPLVVTVACPNSGLTAGKPFNCTVSATGGTAPYTGTGTRSATQPTKGTFTQSFTVTDANAVSASGSDPVTIAAQPLVVTVDCPNTGLTAGKPFNCNVSATGGTAPYTGTGVRSATQPTKGTFTQSFTVTDANAVSATGSDPVTIAAQPLVVTVNCPNTGLTAGKPFNCTVSATGGTAPYTGTGTFSVTRPTKGTFTQSFTVTDSNAVSATGSDPVTIAAQPLLVAVDCPNTGLTAGKPFNCNVTATGGTAPYTGTGSMSVTRPTKGTFTQSFTVTDANAVSATGSDSVTIAAQPLTTSFTFTPASPLVGQAVTFTATATGGTGPYTFAWNFGDSSTGTGSPVSHTYAAKGSFTVTLTTTDANAVVATSVRTVAVSGNPLVVTVACPNTGLTAGKPFNCTVAATGGTAPYTGTGTRSATQPTKGSFTQSFTVTDANGASATGSDPVTIAAQPLVVTVDCPNTGLTAGKPFTCNVTATGGTAPYTGTGSMSVTRPTKGTFTQSFTVTDANAVSATGSDSVTIAGQPLVVTVNCPNTGLTAGKPFNCTVSATGGTSPYTGTGTISVTRPTKGTFTQSFTVTDGNAVTATGSDSVTIAAQPLVVTVNCPNSGLTAGKPFDCIVSATGGTAPYTGTGTFSRSFAVKGTNTLTFTVTDVNGASASGSDSVTIAAQPLVVTVDCPNTGLTAGKPFNCNVSATGGTAPYTGTGSRSATQATKGTFTQTFTVTDSNAVSASGSDSVTINGQPIVVTVDCPNTGLTAGKPFNCTVSATGGTAPYTGTGSMSVTRPTKGTFTQSFTVTDSNAVSATGSDSVTIAAQPLVVTVDCPNTGLTAGKPFNCNVTATGGTAPYTGTGSMSVTRPTKGTFTQTFSVTDANAVTASGSDSVTIAAQPLVVTVDCPNTGLTAGKAFNCTVSAIGGTAPYTGTGSRSATQPTKGTFTQSFSVTDANAVTASGSDSVTIAAQPLTTSFTFTPASPLVGQSVTFTATASGGTGPYTFSWNFGDSSTGTGSPVSHTYAAKGSFTVTLTTRDANNVVATSVQTVAVSGQTLVVTVACPNTGLTAGKPFNCTVSATGGTAPYTGTGTRSATQPTKGTFTQSFSVTDANGATASGSDPVTIAAQPLVVTVDCPNTGLTAGKPFTCNVTATGGTAPYTGTGSMSVTRPTKGTFTQSFTVTDSNAVSATGSDSVTIAGQPLTTSFTFTPASPLVGQAVTFTATATGGTGPYTFAWNFGDSSTGTGSPVSHTYAAKGSFTVTLTTTDANAVVATSVRTVAVSGNPLVVTVACPNTGLTAGKPFNCTVSATGGTAPYTGTGSRSASFPAKGTNTVSFTVTDANGASASGSDSVTIAAQPIVVTVDCPNTGLTAGKPFNCNVSATGGTAPYTGTGVRSATQPAKGTFAQSFSVTDANGATASGSDSVTIAGQPLVVTVDCPNTGLTAGKPFNCTVSATGGTAPYTGTGSRSATQPVKGTFTQSFTVTDANSVSASGSDSVTIAAQPLVVTVDCPNTGLTAGKPFNCNVTATGGTAPYTGTGSQSVTRPTKGTFTQSFTVTDANGGSATGSDSVTIAAQPLVVTVDCPNTGLTAGKPFNCNVSATGGTAPYTGTGSQSVTRPTKGTFTQSFTVTDSNAVSATGSDSVTIAGQPLTTSFTFTPASPLVGQAVTFTATATGGTGPYTFAWNFGDSSTGTGSPVSHTYTVKGSFTVTLTTTDANAVVATSVRTVAVSGQALVVTVDCPNTGLTAGKPFNCTVSATGGTAPYTGTGSRSATQPTKGTFTQSFSVTDANGATASGSDSVTIAAQPLVVTVDCPNTGLTAGKPFTCNVTATGGTAPYTGTGSLSVTRPTKGTFTQSFTVTDANAASATGSDTVTIAGQPLVVTVDCPNTGLTAGKPFNCNVTATGGTAPYTGTGSMSVTRPTKGTFTQSFTVTDANAVSASGSDSVTIAAQPLIVTVDCPNTGLTAGKPFNCNVSATGGTTPYTGTGVRSATQPTKGTFTQSFTVTDSNGVSASGSDSVTIAAQPLVVTVDCPNTGLTAGKPFNCNVSATGGTAPYTGTGSQSVTRPTKGTFTQSFTVTDSNAVSATGSDSVTIAGQPLTTSFTFTPASPLVGQSVTFTATATGGTGPYSFAWNFGDGTTGTGSPVSHAYATKGSFTVTLTTTDANAVVATSVRTVAVSGQTLVVTVDCPNTGLTAGKPFNCNVSATGGTAPYTGTGSQSVTRPTKGTFTQTFTVTDANGASASASDSVTIAPQPLVATVDCPNSGLTAGKPFNCTVSASGGSSPYTGTGTFQRSFAVKGTNTLTFTVTDSNGVSATGSDTVVIGPQPLAASFTRSPTTVTVNKPVTFTATASGGTGPYTFSWNFGDSSTGSGNPVSHTYTAPGSVTVTLTVTDANAATTTVTQQVQVSSQGLVITATCTNPTAGKPASCTASASGGVPPYTFTWDVGKDGTIDGTGPSFQPVFPVKGSFSIDAIVTDSAGNTAQSNIPVTVTPQPLAVTVDCPNSGLTAGKPFNCNVSATGGTGPYTGTGSRSATQPTKGTFTQSFTVTDSNGASASGSDSVTIAPQPLTVTVACPNTGLTAGKPFNCTVSATGGTAPYTGTGSRSAAQPTKGTFTQTFTVTDANGASASASDSVTIAPQPLVATVDCPNSGLTAGKPFNCTVSATGGTAPYTGTGSRSASFPAKGTYTVSFMVTDSNGVTAQGSDTVTIAAQPFVVTVDCPNTGLTAGKPFNCNVSATGGTAPYSGTGSRSASFPVKGTYTVSFTVTDANGASASGSDTVTIAPQPLVADFTFAPASPQSGQSVTFTATVSGGTGPYSFSWNFGDGTSGSGNPVSHAYVSKGTYGVSLTVTDANAATASASHSVTVLPNPLVADFSFSPPSPAVNQTVTFTGTVSGGTSPYMFSWSFGDGATGTGNPASHAYSATGSYLVTMTVTDANSATATASHTVTVSTGVPGAPTACFVASAIKKGQVIGVGSPGVKFDGKCSMAAEGLTLNNYAWDFGDGTSASGPELKVPTHIYAVNGTYIVTLTVTQRDGLTDTESQSIDVKPAPIVDSLNFKRNMKASQSLTQTWTVNLINPNAFAIYAMVEITGTADTIGAFSVSSGPVLLPAGSTTPIMLSKTFTAFDIGLTYNFQVKVTFSGTGIGGPYELGAIQTDYFRIRP